MAESNTAKKPSFFRRFSLSSSVRPKPAQDRRADVRHVSESSSQRNDKDHVESLLYDSLRTGITQNKPPKSQEREQPVRISGGMVTVQASSPKRNPIYPALASPPNSPPRIRATHREEMATNHSHNADHGQLDVSALTANTRKKVSSRSASNSRPPPSSFPGNRSAFQDNNSQLPLSEARAYAQAVSARQSPANDVSKVAPEVPMEKRKSRPLPRPPSAANTHASEPETTIPTSTTFIDFTRSPTLPDLVDPRFAPAENTSMLSRGDLPVRSASRGNAAFASTTARGGGDNGSGIPQFALRATSPTEEGQSLALPSGDLWRFDWTRHGTGYDTSVTSKPDLLTLLALTHVQESLLGFISINTFLSLLGSSKLVRACFTGEMVGKWVMGEWGIQLDNARGRSWPNLTVWEGFLESLLHDPATYSTYPKQWHSLLSHLSLSHTLIVLHLRNLPPATLPSIEDNFTSSVRLDSDAGSVIQMPKKEHVMEIIMPEPLAEKEQGRRGSNSPSISTTRRRSSSLAGKAPLPPISYPAPKRYGFTRHSDTRTRTGSESSRPGSVFSVQTSPSVALSQWMKPMKPEGRPNRIESPIRRHLRIEPAFDKPPPFVPGRAPILRVFVPLVRWPSAEGAAAAVAELNKCGAMRRLRLGDLVVNTACRPQTTEHVLLYTPNVRHLLVPLEYRYSSNGHLPAYFDAFAVPPSYYYPFLPNQVVHLDLRPYASRAMQSLRLAFDRQDVTIASGARIAAKRYLYVAGFEVIEGDPAAKEWQGMVYLEADGTTEGKEAIISRLSSMGAWEIIREKSVTGVWLKLLP